MTERTTVVDRKVRTKVGDLWGSWRSWCDEAGERPGRTQDFAAALDEHGIEVETYQNARYARGLALRDDERG
jgi:hypothetical protein